MNIKEFYKFVSERIGIVEENGMLTLDTMTNLTIPCDNLLAICMICNGFDIWRDTPIHAMCIKNSKRTVFSYFSEVCFA